MVNGCCWLNHNDGPQSRRFIEIVRENPCIKGWFSGHFHLSHDYEDSMSLPEGNNRGACVFAQTAVMTARSTRDGRRQSRMIRGNKDGFEVCTVNHAKGGEVRVDAKCSYAGDTTVAEIQFDLETTWAEAGFRAYTPQEEDGCYIENAGGVLNEDENWDENTVCWWHMADGVVLGVHDGMVIEYDPTTLAPLGMVVSKDELLGRKVAVIDSGLKQEQCDVFEDGAECVDQSSREQALILPLPLPLIPTPTPHPYPYPSPLPLPLSTLILTLALTLTLTLTLTPPTVRHAPELEGEGEGEG